ncbi:MAG: SprB repeat-containing protein [Bacteroidetes bacterium]|nr:SprB repeat-containing protein [Bacteroidota bacterium]
MYRRSHIHNKRTRPQRSYEVAYHDVLCNGGTDASIDVTVTGNNGANLLAGTMAIPNEDRTGLSAGTYRNGH